VVDSFLSSIFVGARDSKTTRQEDRNTPIFNRLDWQRLPDTHSEVGAIETGKSASSATLSPKRLKRIVKLIASVG